MSTPLAPSKYANMTLTEIFAQISPDALIEYIAKEYGTVYPSIITDELFNVRINDTHILGWKLARKDKFSEHR